jgi:hypothetical protein
MDNTIQINNIRRKMGQLLISGGITQMNESINELAGTEGTFAQFCKPLLGLPVSQLDEKYYFVSFDNWLKIIESLNPLTKEFYWVAEKRDCDKRAMFITSMVAMLFEINTIRPIYCDVYRVGDGQFAYAHYANVIVDNAGNAYLWDADEGGAYTKITAQNPIINNKRYFLKSVR